MVGLTNICSKFEQQYMDIMAGLIKDGTPRGDRTGVGTQAKFATELRHDWKDGFPLITHRTLNPTAAMAEMSCFIKGLTDVSEFVKRGCKWWLANLDNFNERNGTPENTDLGPIYGSLWRDFHGTDQLKWLLAEAKSNPTSRRLLVTAWDPSQQAKAVLPPCHYSFQIFIDGDELDLLFNMRSVDWVLGCPNDMIAYGFLQLAICRELNKEPRELILHSADTHIYANHIEGAQQLLQTFVHRRLPSWAWADMPSYESCMGKTDEDLGFFELEAQDLGVERIEQGPSVKFQMAV